MRYEVTTRTQTPSGLVMGWPPLVDVSIYRWRWRALLCVWMARVYCASGLGMIVERTLRVID